MNGLALDLRRAARRLARTPGFTLLALATLALGIGANAALFSVVHAVLLKPLPFEDPDEVYAIWSRHTSTERYPVSLPEFCDFRDRNRTLEALAGVANWTAQPRRRVGHRAPAGAARLGQLLRAARRRSGARPHAARGGRHAREREGRGALPRPLAAPLRGRPGCRRPADHAQRRRVHGGRRDVARVRVPGPRHRPGDPARARDRSLAAQPRVDELPAPRRPRTRRRGPRGRRGRPRPDRRTASEGVPRHLRAQAGRDGPVVPGRADAQRRPDAARC